MTTFQDLLTEILRLSSEEFVDWLSVPWTGKDKQESLFRLFAHQGQISEFKDHRVCSGKFNLGTLKPIDDPSEFLNVNLKDRGDYSDLTLIKDKSIIATTSKNLGTYNVGDLDISNRTWVIYL